nr:helicase associated domain-containing protein [Cellulomonas hominis]
MEARGFAFVRFEPDEHWRQGVERLRAYVRLHGDALVRRDVVTDDGFRLGGWVSEVRSRRTAGELDDARVRELDDLGMVWRIRASGPRLGQQVSSAMRFRARLRLLDAFIGEHGHCDVPSTYLVDGFNLGAWVRKQRLLHAQGKLAPERTKALESRRFTWRARDNGALWSSGLAALDAFIAEHGHPRVPTAHVTADGLRLGLWASRRRAELRSGSLPPQRREALVARGFPPE